MTDFNPDGEQYANRLARLDVTYGEIYEAHHRLVDQLFDEIRNRAGYRKEWEDQLDDQLKTLWQEASTEPLIADLNRAVARDGLTNQQIATRVDYDVGGITRILNGQRHTMEVICRIFDAYEWPVPTVRFRRILANCAVLSHLGREVWRDREVVALISPPDYARLMFLAGSGLWYHGAATLNQEILARAAGEIEDASGCGLAAAGFAPSPRRRTNATSELANLWRNWGRSVLLFLLTVDPNWEVLTCRTN